jgi:hypothetical protein
VLSPALIDIIVTNGRLSTRHGDYIAKIRATPTESSLARVDHGTVDVAAASEADLTTMPVDNTSREWPRALSPFVTVTRNADTAGGLPSVVHRAPLDEQAERHGVGH